MSPRFRRKRGTIRTITNKIVHSLFFFYASCMYLKTLFAFAIFQLSGLWIGLVTTLIRMRTENLSVFLYDKQTFQPFPKLYLLTQLKLLE